MSKPRSPAIVTTLVLMVLLAGVSAACVDDSNQTAGTPEVSSRPPATEDLQDTARCGTATGTSIAELTEITSGRHDAFDRIVLGFTGAEPACTAGYVDQLLADGSANPIPVNGNAFLQVTLSRAAGHTDDGARTYNGPDKIDTPDLENITAVALAGDFEGYVTVGLGMSRKTHYKVFTLSEPTRVVIDVGH